MKERWRWLWRLRRCLGKDGTIKMKDELGRNKVGPGRAGLEVILLTRLFGLVIVLFHVSRFKEAPSLL